MYVVLCIQKMNKDILNGVELCERMCGRRGLDSIAGARQKIASFTRLAIFRRSRSLTAPSVISVYVLANLNKSNPNKLQTQLIWI